MDPVLIEIGPVVIRWYGVMMAVTILTGAAIAYRYGPRFGIPTKELDRLTVPFILLAFAGARIGYVLSHPAEFASVVDILRIDRGGLTSHGAIVGGFTAIVVASRRRALSLWDLADTVVWAIPTGNIFVRFGNFMNGELYGDVTSLPWAVTFPGIPGPRHPLQIYEMIFALAILGVAVRLARHRRLAGQLFWTVVVLTSIGRISLDLLRSEDRVFWVITLGQIPAALLVILGVWFLATRSKSTQSAQSTRSSQP